MKKINKKSKESEILPSIRIPKIKINKNYIALTIIGIILIALVIAAIVYKEKTVYFDYKNISFYKNYYGRILFYTALINTQDSTGKMTLNQSIDFRNDPRKIGSIPSNITKLGLIFNKPLYITENNIKPGCENAGIAFINLARFNANLARDIWGKEPEIKGATANRSLAEGSNLTFADCKTYPSNTVILISQGNETKIEQTGPYCYEITFKNCEVLQATERFELAILDRIIN
jgi:hypothetical protein